MSALLKRAHRVLLITVAAVFGLTLLAPVATLANTDIQVGQQATIANPNGTGANLRLDPVLDDTAVIAEIPQGTTVAVTDGPYVNDAGTWFWVVSDVGEGFVSANMLGSIETAPAEEPVTEEEVTDPVTEEAPTSPDLLWQEPVDAGFVVDNDNTLPAEGLACRTTATVDGEVITRVSANATLQVAGPRIWQGEQSFVHVNCGEGAGYVNGDYVVLESEQAAEPAPTEVVEAPVTEEPTVAPETTEEPVATEEPVVTEEPAVEEPATEATGETGPRFVTDNVNLRTGASDESDVITVLATGEQVELTGIVGDGYVEVSANAGTGFVAQEFLGTEAPVATEPTEEVAPTEELVETEVPTEEAVETEEPTEAPVETEEPTETTPEEPVVPTEEPVETEVPTEEPTTPAEEATEVPSDEATEETGDLVEPPAEIEAPATEEVTSPTPVETTEPTEEATETAPVEEEPTEVPAEPTEETVETPVATEEVVETPAETEVPTEEPVVTEEPEDETPAVTAPAFDASAMIGSATVTGTNGDGLICRVSPESGAATLMILSEGTKVLVSAEPVNGYLGIDCGGIQGFADVNHLWSGGAGDEEIQKASMSLVVSGTGNGLNCRTGAGTNNPVITVLRDGTSLTTRAAATNGWVAVTCAGQNGFVATPYVDVSGSSGSGSSSTGTASGTATVSNTNGDGLYCRSGAGTSYSAITVLSPGQSVTVRGANQGSWTPIVCGGTNGFAHSSFLSASSSSGSNNGPSTPGASTGKVTVANTGGQGLNCRSGAGTSNGVITVLRPGQAVDTRSGSTSGWQAVICGGQNGFISSEFVSGGGGGSTNPAPEPPSTGNGQTATVSNTNGDGLYCRSGAGTGNSVITVLSPGQQVSVRGNASNGWLPITCGGQAGWASSQYLTVGGGSSSPAPSNPEPSNPAPAPSGMKSGDHAKTTATLNLRYNPSLGAGIATSAPTGTVVKVTGGATSGFYPVDWDGLSGYMSGDYLTKTSEALSERGGSGNPTTPPPTSGGGGGTATGNAIVDYAMRYLGYPYVWATHGPASFDCSGFTYWVIQNVVGKNIGYGTWTQVSAGQSVSKSNLQPGDLVFFQNTYTAGLSHVGIYIGNGKFIHAQNESTGVVISDLDSSYYGPRWYGAVRI